MSHLNLEPAALILSLMCLLYSLAVKRKQYRLSKRIKDNLLNQHFMFIVALLSIFFSSAASVAGRLLEETATGSVMPWLYLLHEFYYISHMSLTLCLPFYIMTINGSDIMRGRAIWLFALPCLVSYVLILTNPFTGLVFYMDRQYVHHRGPLLPFLYAVGLVYLIFSFVSFFRNRRAVSRSDSQAIFIMLALTAAGILIQAAWQNLAVELFAEALTTLGLMITLEERSGQMDPITGALNRLAFADANRRLLETNQPYSIVLIRLTNMDLFSGLFTGKEMDSLLIQVSGWLSRLCGETNLFCYRNRNFAVLCTGPEDSAEAAADAVLRRFREGWETAGVSLDINAAVGIIHVPEDISSLDGLMGAFANWNVKSGTGSRLVPRSEMTVLLEEREIEQALRDAVAEKRLKVLYQPIWSTEKRRTVAAEALLCADTGALRGVSPEVYIPIAEQCGLIREIGFFVFEEVCHFIHSKHPRRLGLEYIEVNLSVFQLMNDDLVRRFEDIRTRYGVPVEALNLEITETASAGGTSGITQKMEELRALGYTFSLDDFGTGYSNLVQFINGGYKNIKMDKSFLWDAEKNEAAAHLLDTMIRVIRSIGCSVVQEGVETAAQLKRTEASGGNLIQGYYFSRPLPEADFIAYLEEEGRQHTA